MTNPLIRLGELGQSPWFDNITNDLITSAYRSTEKSRVMLMLIPSARQCSIAGMPSAVPGIFTITLGRLTACQSRSASAIVPAVSLPSVGETSIETVPSTPPVAS
jgi:hypothetical protein